MRFERHNHALTVKGQEVANWMAYYGGPSGARLSRRESFRLKPVEVTVPIVQFKMIGIDLSHEELSYIFPSFWL